jgi:hypothetical protein
MADTIFDVLGTPLKITDINSPAAGGTKELADLFANFRVDLSGPDKDCLFFFAKFPADATVDGKDYYRFGVVQAKSQAVMALIQQSLQEFIKERTGDPAIAFDIDGVYNCKDAQAMVAAAQEARQTGVGNVDFWPVGPTEFYWLLTRSLLLQNLIAIAVQEQGQTYSQPMQASMILVPMTEAPGLTFVAANVPPVCTGATPPIGPDNSCMPGYQWDPNAGACMSLAVPQCPAGQVWDAQAQACVVSGAGGVSATDKKEDGWWKTPLYVGAGIVAAGGLYYWYRKNHPATAEA